MSAASLASSSSVPARDSDDVARVSLRAAESRAVLDACPYVPPFGDRGAAAIPVRDSSSAPAVVASPSSSSSPSSMTETRSSESLGIGVMSPDATSPYRDVERRWSGGLAVPPCSRCTAAAAASSPVPAPRPPPAPPAPRRPPPSDAASATACAALPILRRPSLTMPLLMNDIRSSSSSSRTPPPGVRVNPRVARRSSLSSVALLVAPETPLDSRDARTAPGVRPSLVVPSDMSARSRTTLRSPSSSELGSSSRASFDVGAGRDATPSTAAGARATTTCAGVARPPASVACIGGACVCRPAGVMMAFGTLPDDNAPAARWRRVASRRAAVAGVTGGNPAPGIHDTDRRISSTRVARVRPHSARTQRPRQSSPAASAHSSPVPLPMRDRCRTLLMPAAPSAAPRPDTACSAFMRLKNAGASVRGGSMHRPASRPENNAFCQGLPGPASAPGARKNIAETARPVAHVDARMSTRCDGVTHSCASSGAAKMDNHTCSRFMIFTNSEYSCREKTATTLSAVFLSLPLELPSLAPLPLLRAGAGEMTPTGLSLSRWLPKKPLRAGPGPTAGVVVRDVPSAAGVVRSGVVVLLTFSFSNRSRFGRSSVP
mmetsp:Transcript_2642/g.9171  ORF Transcript_2642/g.9171 Transcript_2642/m.9171 type:complete len:603 (+) Transcript_2642:1951-3759(+)